MIKYLSREKGFASLIGMLVVLGLVCLLTYYLINSYYRPAQTLQVEEPQGSKASVSYSTIVSHSRDKVEQINKKSQNQFKQLEEMSK